MNALDDADRQALRRPALLKAAVELHVAPARYVHPDRLPQLGFNDPSFFARLTASRRGERRVSDLIIQRAKLPAEGCFQFAADRFRLALLPFSVLDRLCTFASAASLRRELSTLIDRTSRQRMEAVMGVEARDFALKEASVTLGPLCADHWAPAPVAELPARFHYNRSRCLEDCMAEAPKALTERLALKLPPSWDCDFSGPIPPERADKAWTMIRRLLRSKIPQGGGPCFA
jgi:hypothetical protein